MGRKVDDRYGSETSVLSVVGKQAPDAESTEQWASALASVRQQIQSGEGMSALIALDALRLRYPYQDHIVLYWCDIALRLNQIEQAITCAQAMQARARTAMWKVKWGAKLGSAYMQGTDFPEACRALSHVLTVLSDLAMTGKIPAPTDVVPSTTFDVVSAEKRLWQVLGSLKAAGAQAFPMYGTLLGLVREGRLLPFDKDLDLGVWIEDFRTTCQHLRDLGMQTAPMALPYDNFTALIDPTTGLTFDICGLRREPERQRVVGGFWLYGKPPDHQRITVLPWFELVTQERPAGAIWWPMPPEALLTAVYGDWRTPRPEWDSVISALNIQPDSLQQRCYAYLRLIGRWLTGDIAKTRRYLDQVSACLPDDSLVERCRVALDQVLSEMSKHA